MSQFTLMKILGYAGLVPFLVPVYLMGQAFFSAPGLQSAAIFGLYAPYVFIAYSAVILSFLSGTVWAYARHMEGGLSKGAIVVSNLLALSAWLSLLLIYVAPIMTLFALCLLMAGYLGLLVIERQLGVPQTPDYWRLRIQLSAVVSLANLLVILMMVAEL